MLDKLKIFFICILIYAFNPGFIYAEEGCFPEALKSSYESSSNGSSEESTEQIKPSGFVFIDQTLSMEGFVQRNPENNAAQDYNYLRAMDELAFQLSLITENQAFHKYAKDIKPVTSSELNNATSSEFYNCPGSVPASECRNLQSDLESVLSIAAMQPDGFFVIVTDLFLKNTQFFDPKSNIKKSLSTVFDQGQSIGIYGVKSKFNGRVSGLPSGSVYENAESRAFYIITIGKKNQVLEFKDNLAKDVFSSVSEEDINFTIYTNDFVLNTVTPELIKKDDLSSGRGATKNIFYPERYNLHQYDLKHSHIPIQGEFDLYNIQLPNTILLSEFTTNVTLFQSKDIYNCKKWKQLDNVENLVSVSQNGSKVIVEIFGTVEVEGKLNNPASQKFKRKRSYIANIKVIANNIGLNDDEFWLKDWSFTSVDETDLIQSSPTFFPTLNLSRFSTMLENIQQSEFKSLVPIEFNVAVRMN